MMKSKTTKIRKELAKQLSKESKLVAQESLKTAQTFDKLLDLKYGKISSSIRNKYEANANLFVKVNA